jgi:prepilin-type N-terminal cleavage/methylation domain-containing protein
MNNKNFRRGFSLVEMVIVVLIIGIVALATIPRYQDYWTRHSLQSACQRVAADLRHAQSHAMSTSQNVDVNFSVSPDDSYSIPSLDSEANALLVYSVNVNGVPYRSSIHSANFDGDAVVVFNPFGIPDSAGSVTLSAGGFIQSVLVSATGGVSIGNRATSVTAAPIDGGVVDAF